MLRERSLVDTRGGASLRQGAKGPLRGNDDFEDGGQTIPVGPVLFPLFQKVAEGVVHCL